MNPNYKPMIAVLTALLIVILMLNHRDKFNYDELSRRTSALCNVAGSSSKEKMFSLFRAQSARRRQLLEKKQPNWMAVYNVLVPEVYCPYLVRVGDENDGGKWICDPFQIPAKCGIYSLGINNDPSFDKAIQEITEKTCKIYAYDQFDQSAATLATLSSINGVFKRAKIGTVTNKDTHEWKMADLLAENGHSRIEILKMDIEGAELKVMPFLLETTPACQILTEIHGTPDQAMELLRKFSAHGYRLLTHEINGMHHSLSEYSHIHESCLEQYGAELMAAYI